MSETGEQGVPLFAVPRRSQGPPSVASRSLESSTLVAAGIAGLLALWVGLSWALGSRTLPGPLVVARFLWTDTRTGELPYHVGVTMARVLSASTLALAAGGFLGVLTGLSRRLDMVLSPWVVAGLAVPRLVVIVVAYLLVGLNEAAAVVATAVTVLPSVAVAVREGIHAMDWGLVDMGRVFRVPALRRWRDVVWPQLLPYVTGSARNAVSLSLKMMVFAELLGRSSGIGYEIAFYFQTFNMGQILTYGVAAVLVAAAMEFLLRTVERRLYRWRPAR